MTNERIEDVEKIEWMSNSALKLYFRRDSIEQAEGDVE